LLLGTSIFDAEIALQMRRHSRKTPSILFAGKSKIYTDHCHQDFKYSAPEFVHLSNERMNLEFLKAYFPLQQNENERRRWLLLSQYSGNGML
jgi:hypothetical protein